MPSFRSSKPRGSMRPAAVDVGPGFCKLARWNGFLGASTITSAISRVRSCWVRSRSITSERRPLSRARQRPLAGMRGAERPAFPVAVVNAIFGFFPSRSRISAVVTASSPLNSTRSVRLAPAAARELEQFVAAEHEALGEAPSILEQDPPSLLVDDDAMSGTCLTSAEPLHFREGVDVLVRTFCGFAPCKGRKLLDADELPRAGSLLRKRR